VRLHVALAIVEGVDAASADDPSALERALEAGVRAGGFTLLRMTSAKFSPQGATAAAIVGESHLALHSWPEKARLFVDVASCSSRQSVRHALAAIVESFPGARVASLDERELSADGAPATPR
jgi:S-adenosylmethionine decarboxylase